MKNNFILETAEICGAKAFVVATGSHSPLEHRFALEDRLKREGVCGEVLFDLLLSLGTQSRRYFVANFDGEKLGQLTTAKNIPPAYPERSALTLKKYSASLDCSLLGSALEFAVHRGYRI